MFAFTVVALIYLCFELILVLGLNIQYGLTGILNLAYIIFYAIGAYIAGILTGPPSSIGLTHIGGYELPFYVGIAGAMGAAGVLAVVVGAFTLGRRLRASYLAVGTLVIAVVALQVVSQDLALFNGQLGLLDVPQPFGRGMSGNGFSGLYCVILICIVIALYVVCERLRRSPFGRMLRAIRDDEIATQVFGYAIFRMKLKAFVFGGVISGLAGCLTMFYIGSFSPAGWSVYEVIFALTCIFVGGAGNNLGVVVGTIIVEIVFVQLTSLVPTLQSNPELVQLVRAGAIGLVLILTLRFRPQGLIPERPEQMAPDGPALGALRIRPLSALSRPAGTSRREKQI